MGLRVAIWCAVSTEKQAEKVSLGEQERVGREFCERYGHDVVRVFKWDGYSRYESDLVDALDDFAAQQRFEYHELRDLWKAKAFDILYCYHDSRLARNEVLYAWVVVNVLRSGATIYRHIGGPIDQESKTFQTALGMIAATASVEHLIKGRKAAMRERRKQGKTTTAHLIESHSRIRDAKTGAEVAIAVDETKRPLFDALATLILEGIGWQDMEKHLKARYGICYPGKDGELGDQFAHGRMYALVMNPFFWGHNAQYFRGKKQNYGDWRLEPGHVIPEGVEISYNVHPPVWEGELADAIKAEIRRRKLHFGRYSPRAPFRFSGLFVCDECGYAFSKLSGRNGKSGIRCQTKYYARGPNSSVRPECSQTIPLKTEDAQAYLDKALKRMIARKDPFLLMNSSRASTIEKQRTQAEAKLQKAQHKATTLVRQRLEAAHSLEHLQDVFTQQLNELNTEIGQLKSQLRALETQQVNGSVLQSAQSAYSQIAAFSDNGDLTRFWEQPDLLVHQLLTDVLGNRRLAVLDGQVRRTVDASTFNRRRSK